MSRIEYFRSDLSVQIEAQDQGAIARFSSGRAESEVQIPPSLVGNATRGQPVASEIGERQVREAAIEKLIRGAEKMGSVFVAWRRARELMKPGQAEGFLPRMTLDIRDPRLTELGWERILRALAKIAESAAVVRLSPVWPRAARVPLTFPIRVLEVTLEKGESADLASVMSYVFGRQDFADAVVVSRASLPDVLAFRERERWPTAEVLHLWPSGEGLPAEQLLSTAAPEEPGTLGWLLRLTDTWQTRLVVLEHTGASEAHALLLRLAHVLTGRGGPAVLVLPRDRAPRWPFEEPRRILYGGLAHDQPFDSIVRELQGLNPPLDFPGALSAGAGREESLRPSAIGVALSSPRVGRTLVSLAKAELPAREAVLAGPAPPLPAASVADFSRTLGEMGPFMKLTTFDRERKGILPLAGRVRKLRDLVVTPLGYWGFRRTPKIVDGSRHVNARLCAESPPRQPTPIPLDGPGLAPGQVVHLRVQIGRKAKDLKTIGPAALLEEVFHWTAESTGAHIEIAVTGIDFEVLGDPVQELWLPARGPTDAIFFALTPKRKTLHRGVALLRFCLYYRNNLFQSFRIAARLRSATRQRAALARAIGVPVAELPGEPTPLYLTRMEYARLPETDGVASLPGRALSFTVNDAAGRAVVTVKGKDLFESHIDDNLTCKVELLRAALQKVSVRESTLLPGKTEYAFDRGGQNKGDPAALKAALRELAAPGWDLYSLLVQGEEQRQNVKVNLSDAEAGQIVHAAHIDLTKVIPWSLVYDRYYDADRTEIGGRDVHHDTCLAALGPGGALRASRCETLPECLLHRDQVAARERAGDPPLPSDIVACPLRFWGFKHVVEVLAQQSLEKGQAPPPPPAEVTADRPVRVVAALHTGLSLMQSHLQSLRNYLARLEATLDPGPIYDRNNLLDRLRETQPDLVYLYCHARPGSPRSAAYLEFLDAKGKPGRITAAQLDGVPWAHSPLVVLNACGTAGFIPSAPSEFVTKLINQRLAGGVIGSEVEVWEALAGEMALLFLERFLDPQGPSPAGQALLHARRALLGKYNPLGLVYTLYAPAELQLGRRQGGVGSNAQLSVG